jgi:hypothetical protein
MSSLATAALYIGGASLVVGVAGTGVSLYGSSQSSAAQKAAASQNAALQRQQATASAAVARYQAQLNYKVAMAQADVADKNAVNLHQQARVTEKVGGEGINRMIEGQDAQNSANRASIGSSGVTTDSGSPLVVNAYNAGMQQLGRMDALYATNVAAGEKDWAGTMQSYQAAVTRETAKQYQYAEAMANWSEKMGIASAGVQQQQANNVADASMISGYGNALSSIGSAISNAGYAYMNYNSFKTPAGIQPNQSLLSSGGINPAAQYYAGGQFSLGNH